ncbi:MAG: peptide deformylase [Pelagibacterales bacterium]|nr:peptide deformylase [Pelagibacterales bacterium]OUU63245.1 MAG: peptide deformylase [Alphaproteobacteria bacterium TMED62]
MKIIVAPDNRLNQVSKKIDIVDNTTISILDQMLECMYKNNGIGLAAPQVGILKRLVVVDCNDKSNNKKPLKLINPEIIKLSTENSEFEEGCLSLPTQYAKVKRPTEIIIKFQNVKGVFCKEVFSGLEATCIQHEIDHLDGKLFVDHISKLKKNIIIKKLIKLKKKNKK